MTKYSKIVTIPGTVLYMALGGSGERESALSGLTYPVPTVVNEHLEQGYELIQIVTHRDDQREGTATMFILGKPRESQE